MKVSNIWTRPDFLKLSLAIQTFCVIHMYVLSNLLKPLVWVIKSELWWNIMLSSLCITALLRSSLCSIKSFSHPETAGDRKICRAFVRILSMGKSGLNLKDNQKQQVLVYFEYIKIFDKMQDRRGKFGQVNPLKWTLLQG